MRGYLLAASAILVASAVSVLGQALSDPTGSSSFGSQAISTFSTSTITSAPSLPRSSTITRIEEFNGTTSITTSPIIDTLTIVTRTPPSSSSVRPSTVFPSSGFPSGTSNATPTSNGSSKVSTGFPPWALGILIPILAVIGGGIIYVFCFASRRQRNEARLDHMPSPPVAEVEYQQNGTLWRHGPMDATGLRAR